MSQTDHDPWKTTAFVTIGICLTVLCYIGYSVLTANRPPKDNPHIQIELQAISDFVKGGSYHTKKKEFANKTKQLLSFKKSQDISPQQIQQTDKLLYVIDQAQKIERILSQCEALIDSQKESDARGILETHLDHYPSQRVGHEELKALNDKVKHIERRKEDVKKQFFALAEYLIKEDYDSCLQYVHNHIRSQTGDDRIKAGFKFFSRQIRANKIQKNDIRIKKISWKEQSHQATIYAEFYYQKEWQTMRRPLEWEYINNRWYLKPLK